MLKYINKPRGIYQALILISTNPYRQVDYFGWSSTDFFFYGEVTTITLVIKPLTPKWTPDPVNGLKKCANHPPLGEPALRGWSCIFGATSASKSLFSGHGPARYWCNYPLSNIHRMTITHLPTTVQRCKKRDQQAKHRQCCIALQSIAYLDHRKIFKNPVSL